jgi:hypothetical protein
MDCDRWRRFGTSDILSHEIWTVEAHMFLGSPFLHGSVGLVICSSISILDVLYLNPLFSCPVAKECHNMHLPSGSVKMCLNSLFCDSTGLLGCFFPSNLPRACL